MYTWGQTHNLPPPTPPPSAGQGPTDWAKPAMVNTYFFFFFESV